MIRMTRARRALTNAGWTVSEVLDPRADLPLYSVTRGEERHVGPTLTVLAQDHATKEWFALEGVSHKVLS